MIQTITYDGETYPKFQASGNAARFAIPFAREVCHGWGFDVGASRADWAFPGAVIVDFAMPGVWHADQLPPGSPDYIFSSHCLEHVPDWVATMDYWFECLAPGGVLFLYLPHFSQHYWRPWNNRKHRHALSPEFLWEYMQARGYRKVFVSGPDLNCSFIAMGEKPNTSQPPPCPQTSTST